MEHQRQAHRFERRAGNFRTLIRRRRRHLLAEHMRDGYAGALEHRAVAQDAALAAAALGSNPSVALKFHRIDFLDRRGDAVLQLMQVSLDRGCVCRIGFWLNTQTGS